MKKHFIFLGAPGVIYYSWLLALVFVGVCFAYESNKSLSIPSLILCSLFGILLIYTWFSSFIKKNNKEYIFRLPYKKQVKVPTPLLKYEWSIFKIYQIKDDYQKYDILLIDRKKSCNGNRH